MTQHITLLATRREKSLQWGFFDFCREEGIPTGKIAILQGFVEIFVFRIFTALFLPL